MKSKRKWFGNIHREISLRNHVRLRYCNWYRMTWMKSQICSTSFGRARVSPI